MIKEVKISEITENPDNPRYIKDFKYKKLVQSIKEFPEMLKLRPIVVNEHNVILGGNMRYKACIEAGLKKVHIMYAKDLTIEQQKEFVIKDNVNFGEWDWDSLGNDWPYEELEEWGLELKFMGENDADEEWLDMPEFKQEDLTPVRQIIVSFKTDEDVQEFANIVGQKLTDKTKSIWYPKQEIDEVKDLRY